MAQTTQIPDVVVAGETAAPMEAVTDNGGNGLKSIGDLKTLDELLKAYYKFVSSQSITGFRYLANAAATNTCNATPLLEWCRACFPYTGGYHTPEVISKNVKQEISFNYQQIQEFLIGFQNEVGSLYSRLSPMNSPEGSILANKLEKAVKEKMSDQIVQAVRGVYSKRLEENADITDDTVFKVGFNALLFTSLPSSEDMKKELTKLYCNEKKLFSSMTEQQQQSLWDEVLLRFKGFGHFSLNDSLSKGTMNWPLDHTDHFQAVTARLDKFERERWTPNPSNQPPFIAFPTTLTMSGYKQMSMGWFKGSVLAPYITDPMSKELVDQFQAIAKQEIVRNSEKVVIQSGCVLLKNTLCALDAECDLLVQAAEAGQLSNQGATNLTRSKPARSIAWSQGWYILTNTGFKLLPTETLPARADFWNNVAWCVPKLKFVNLGWDWRLPRSSTDGGASQVSQNVSQ